MKHAYLIIAHNELEVLLKLVSCLDDVRNDIFIHWDAKSGAIPALKTEKAGLFFTDVRIDVRWGGFSMVEAEYVLFEEAVARGPYQYYHLISGVDLPIKSQDYIHGFCDSHAGTEFIAYADASAEELGYRFNHYFFFSEDFKSRNIIKRASRLAFLKVQDLLHIRRNTGITVKKGSQWCSLTQDCVQYIIDHKKYVRKLFKHTFSPDEMFIQTLCFNSEFKERIRKADTEFEGNLRYIKWVKGELMDVSDDDLESLKVSERWFARKFSGKNAELIDIVANFVNCI